MPEPALFPWSVVSEVIVVADPPRYRVAIRAANGYRVAVEERPERWEQALVDFELICVAVNDYHRRTLQANRVVNSSSS